MIANIPVRESAQRLPLCRQTLHCQDASMNLFQAWRVSGASIPQAYENASIVMESRTRQKVFSWIPPMLHQGIRPDAWTGVKAATLSKNPRWQSWLAWAGCDVLGVKHLIALVWSGRRVAQGGQVRGQDDGRASPGSDWRARVPPMLSARSRMLTKPRLEDSLDPRPRLHEDMPAQG